MLASALPSREGIRACSNEQKKITSPIASQAALIAPLAIPLRRADNRLGPILIPTPHPNLKESMPTHSDCPNRCPSDIHPMALLIIPVPSPLMKEICNHIHQPIKRCQPDAHIRLAFLFSPPTRRWRYVRDLPRHYHADITRSHPAGARSSCIYYFWA